MIKFIAAAIWICVATVGAVFYSFQSASTQTEAEAKKPMFGGLDYVRSDVISVPLIHDATVDGYFLTRLVYTIESAQLAKMSVPAAALISDQVYSYLYTNPQIDFTKGKSIDVDAFRANIRDTVNKRVGSDLVKDVLIEQVDYLSKTEIRDNAMRRNGVETDAAPPKEATEAAPAH
jgi:flagellar basal body-associated protein FliL